MPYVHKFICGFIHGVSSRKSCRELLNGACSLYFKIFKHKEKIQDISTTASNEATLESMLQKVIKGKSHFKGDKSKNVFVSLASLGLH